MDYENLLNTGRLKSLQTHNGKVVDVETKPAPQYEVTFEVIDTKLKQQKKASTVISIHRTVSQDLLGAVYADIAKDIKAISNEKSETAA